MDCSTYSTLAECLFVHQTEFNIKLIGLISILAISLYLWFMSSRIDKTKSFYRYFLFLITAYFPIILIMISPFLVLILSNNISFEFYIYLISIIYLIAFSLTIALVGLFFKEKMQVFLDPETKMERQEKRKYSR